MADFKMSVLWSAWTPQIQSRILRDVLSLHRFAKTNNTVLIVACDELLRANIESLGVHASDDFTNPDMCRVYVANGFNIPDDLYPRLPPDVEPVVVSLHGEAVEPNDLVVEEDPYAGVRLYEGVTKIPETMPLDKPAPKGVDPEMPFSPYL